MIFKEIGTITENSIHIKEKYKRALTGLNDFSHLIVLWHFHLIEENADEYLELESPYIHGPEKIGTFATRGPVRPNPIGLSVCSIIDVDVETGVIHIPYIDAEDGTPVLDIKPYEGCIDRVRDLEPPKWCEHWPQYYEDSGTFDWSKEFNF